MSTIELAFWIFGAVATVLFIAGYIRGAKTALATYDDDRIEVNDTGDVRYYWVPIALAVIAATLTIALIGFIPQFVYVGPALAIFTAAANGIAFFLEDAA